GVGGIVSVAILNLSIFFLRILYFIPFELSGRGATPGKRVAGIRVIDRRGGPLTASAVIARNLTRELEVFLPIGILLSAGSGGWGNLLAIGWLIAFLVLLLVHKERLRAGDLVAGTLGDGLPRPRPCRRS